VARAPPPSLLQGRDQAGVSHRRARRCNRKDHGWATHQLLAQVSRPMSRVGRVKPAGQRNRLA
jgi:hypothetical protein